MIPRRLLVLFAAVLLLPALRAVEGDALNGAWRADEDGAQKVLLVADGYWSATVFSEASKQFHVTFGGTYALADDVARTTIQFDSSNPARVGEEMELRLKVADGRMTIFHEDGTMEQWERVDAPRSPLDGVWRISGRKQDGEMRDMPLRARRTLKILAGGRFQWIAMNIETGEFSGTGGGTYTFKDGKYVENIEFFSRDGSRVGARLEFDGSIENGDWHHQGLSSRGEPIYEVWTRLKRDS